MAERREPSYVQCVCPKHGATTWLHRDAEFDDFCLLPAAPAKAATKLVRQASNRGRNEA